MDDGKELLKLTAALDKHIVSTYPETLASIEALKKLQECFWWVSKAEADARLEAAKKKADEDVIETKEAEVVN